MDKRDYFAVAVKDKFIDYDFNYIKEKINSEYKNINEEDFKKIIPITSDRRKLDEFYQQTGITVFYNYVTEEKSLFFNRCGAYPEYDEVFEIEEETMCGVDLSLEKFNRFYIQIN
ncbi:MAG: hypothetical protein KHZ85_07410 [Amedibacillus dolichus]|jgi:hypothetical protein|uniref:Uncharacterized protein n=2 Tax=Amedibacillus dolichus TaxID=31971 RepID=A0A942ZZU3_9FIRM|nr:hypothetical protein [Amedibacillus dolichus]EDP10195.1 hypothetical protein EUBDOL_02209 [Amedibacillus dolichus DSM 3991]MBS4884578.1 hypothetical protein [Amedibacillus dolichus]MEE0383876.1 hypothetical protein [Amedibacillus dolichus]